MKSIILLLIIFTSFTSSSQTLTEKSIKNKIIGTWVVEKDSLLPSNLSDSTILKQVIKFKRNGNCQIKTYYKDTNNFDLTKTTYSISDSINSQNSILIEIENTLECCTWKAMDLNIIIHSITKRELTVENLFANIEYTRQFVNGGKTIMYRLRKKRLLTHA